MYSDRMYNGLGGSTLISHSEILGQITVGLRFVPYFLYVYASWVGFGLWVGGIFRRVGICVWVFPVILSCLQ